MVNENNLMIINRAELKKALCNICECDECHFGKGDCSFNRETFIDNLSISKAYTSDIMKEVRNELIDSLKQLTWETRTEVYNKMDTICKEEKEKLDNAISKATVYLVNKAGAEIPYGTYDYRTQSEQMNVFFIAREVAKEMNCGYKIEPIKRKDLGDKDEI